MVVRELRCYFLRQRYDAWTRWSRREKHRMCQAGAQSGLWAPAGPSQSARHGAGMSPVRGAPCSLWTVCSRACSHIAWDSSEQENAGVLCSCPNVSWSCASPSNIFSPSACRMDSGLLRLMWIDPV